MMIRPHLAAPAVALLLLAGLAACDSAVAEGRAATSAPGTAATAGSVPTDTARAALLTRADLGRIRGTAAGENVVWLVVVSDFQCPYCKVWHDETGPQVERDYVRTGKIRIAYLNFPLSTHRNAWPAHEAAMCAAEQGQFWPVADALFATQSAWKGRSDGVAYFDSLTRAVARTTALDHARLRRCIASGDTRALVQADFDRSLRRGVGSTPTFFVGGQMLLGAQPYAAFQRALDAALAAAAKPAPKPAG